MSAVSRLFVTVIVISLQYHISDAKLQRQQCDAPKFSCKFNDPCDPLCVVDQYVYPGKSARVYVECVEGACAEHQCPRRTIWNQATQRCEGKRNGLEARCSYGKFDCADRNPCIPTLCEAGVENYPGPGTRRYVSCTEGCVEAQCPRRTVWDQKEQRCVPKPIVCSWQEITVSTPAADCTDDFTFNRTKYNDGERGLRHLDGFVDCEAASEGNQYYMEHHNITEETSKSLFSCFKSDGLCLTFTNLNDGVWRHTVYELYEKEGKRRFKSDSSYRALDNEVHPSCNKMDYFDEPAGNLFFDELFGQCYNKGGRLVYQRVLTHYGSCSAKIPCDVTSAEDTIIYEHVCA